MRDALTLYKRGDKSSQDEFAKVLASLEAVKNDRASSQYAQHIETLLAAIPAFATKLLPKDISPLEHVKSCHESIQYYNNRILKAAKER